MTIILQIESSGSRLAFDLFAPATSLAPGSTTVAPGGARLTISEMRFQKALGAHETLSIILEAGREVAVGVFATWLYERLKPHNAKLRIDRIEVLVEENELRRVLIERIESKNAS